MIIDIETEKDPEKLRQRSIQKEKSESRVAGGYLAADFERIPSALSQSSQSDRTDADHS